MAVAEPQLAAERPPLPALLHTWLTTTDHKRLGILYVLMALAFLGLAGVEATLIRLQLFFARGPRPADQLIQADTFNQMFTMHGTTMVFFVGMPILIGLGNYVVPLMIGARDMAFPRVNAFSFWLTLLGGVLMYFSFFTGGAPDVGWFAYAPLTSKAFARGVSTDYWIVGLLISGFGTIGAGVNFIATILCLRAPGMTIGKLPLFVWMMGVTAFLMLLAIPPLTAAQVMLLFDRTLGTHFFDTQAGGSAVLWQHLFWFFGHPEVYILILPVFGVISEVVPVFSRKVIFGYEMVAGATIAIGFIGLSVWAHHMFAVGLTPGLDWFFAGATFLIAVPTGIKIFNWLATLFGGRLVLATPLYFALGFLAMFVLGGLSGIWLAAVPVDWQMTDSYFVVGHFHYVLFGGTLFGVFAAIYYWFPKVTGRMLGERLGKWHFWLLFVGFNLTFGPMHLSGMMGMPRRIAYYQPQPGLGWDALPDVLTADGFGRFVRGWEVWNQLSTVGVAFQAAAFLVFAWNLVASLRAGKPAGDDPWDAWTLEWATSSPPPSYNFETIPVVRSRRPLWDLKHPEDPDWKYE
jgi:cytochrome c oxidase subunit 1